MATIVKSLLSRALVLLTVWLVCQANVIFAANRIVVGQSDVDAGQEDVVIPVTVTNDVALHGISIALSFDPTILTLVRVDEGPALQAIGAQFFNASVDNVAGTLVLGSIFPYDADPFVLVQLDPSPDSPLEIAALHFDVAVEAPAGQWSLQLGSDLGNPPVSNTFTTAGITVAPELAPGSISVINQNVLALQDTQAVPGGSFEVWGLAKHPQPLDGYSVGLTYDKSLVTVEDVVLQNTDAERRLRPANVEFFDFRDDTDFSPDRGRVTVAAIVDYVPPFDGQVIPASPDEFRSITKFRFQSLDDPALIGTTTDLVLQDLPPEVTDALNNRFIVGRASFAPDLLHGTVEFTLGTLMSRGMVNRDNSVNLADSLAILQALFLGTTTPTCYDSGDMNDDGRMNIADALYLLNHLFIGTPPPKPPYGECGFDPTEDDLGCVSQPQCFEG